MIRRLLMKLRARDEISAEEEQAIRDAIVETRDYPPDHIFIRRGEPLDFSTLLLDGLICRFKDLRNGERQVTELHVPGDFAGEGWRYDREPTLERPVFAKSNSAPA